MPALCGLVLLLAGCGGINSQGTINPLMLLIKTRPPAAAKAPALAAADARPAAPVAAP